MSHSWFITVFATRLTGRVPHVKKELPTLPEHLSEFTTTTVSSGVRVARTLVFRVMFCRSLFVLLSFVIVLFVLRSTTSDCPYWYCCIEMNHEWPTGNYIVSPFYGVTLPNDEFSDLCRQKKRRGVNKCFV